MGTKAFSDGMAMQNAWQTQDKDISSIIEDIWRKDIGELFMDKLIMDGDGRRVVFIISFGDILGDGNDVKRDISLM